MLVLLSPSVNVLPSLDCEGAECQSAGSPVGLLGPYDASRLEMIHHHHRPPPPQPAAV